MTAVVHTVMTDEKPGERPVFDEYLDEHGWHVTTGEYDHEELSPPDWITDLDREICKLLAIGLILTPSVISKNIDRPRSSISNRLSTLEAGGLVEKVERGHYKLTEKGYARMLETIEVERSGEESDDRTWHTSKVLSPDEAEKHNDE